MALCTKCNHCLAHQWIFVICKCYTSFLVSSKVKCLLWAKNYIKIYDFISVYIHAYVCVCPRWLYLNWMSYFSVEISNIYNWITTIASDVQLNSMNSIPHTQLESRAQNPDIVGTVDFVCTFWLECWNSNMLGCWSKSKKFH